MGRSLPVMSYELHDGGGLAECPVWLADLILDWLLALSQLGSDNCPTFFY